jgi:anti-sigma B factor antagonist
VRSSGRSDLSVDVAARVGDRVTLTFVGEIDSTNAEIADSFLTRALAVADPPREVVLEMGGVTFIDSNGLSVLVRHRRAAGRDVSMIIENPADHLRRLLEITALDALFELRPASI